MERELERLLTGTTPPTPLPDVEALHRRGVRRRMAVRLSAASAVVALFAMGALAVQGALAPDTIEFGPADRAEGDSGSDPDRDDGSAAESGSPDGREVQAEPPFGLSSGEIDDAAARLPDEGVEPEPEHIDEIRGTQGGRDPELGYVGCHFPEGAGEVADPPAEARHWSEWYDDEARTDDLIRRCLEDDRLDSAGDHAPGPFTVCQEALTSEAREAVIDQHTDDGWDVAPSRGTDDWYGRVAFPAVLAWEADCANADPRSDFGETTIEGLGSLDDYNDRRRVEAAVKARERDCLSYREALALGVATAARLEGDWRVLGLHPDTPPRTGPCAGLDLVALWGTVIVMPEAYWDRGMPEPKALEAEDPRRVDSLGEALMEALEAGDAAGVADAVEQVATLEGHMPSGSLRGGRSPEDGEELSAEVVRTVMSALQLGCLAEPSAVTLALSLHDLLSVHDDADWFVGAVAVEDITDAELDQPEPTCFRLNLANTATFSDQADPGPAIVVEPLWLD